MKKERRKGIPSPASKKPPFPHNLYILYPHISFTRQLKKEKQSMASYHIT